MTRVFLSMAVALKFYKHTEPILTRLLGMQLL